MRTTLSLDDDILAVARTLASARGTSVGAIVSELARRGLAPDPVVAEPGGFPVFRVSPDAPPITEETVRSALDER